ncbi:tRNA1Val (adenine37-N6)-methyltransferase [Arcicella aurantiaca]|uniref:tRNA1(Val) (adenine(37)-N6)-methyltransferase n=1 Tax=Arcicella aurantiaca TaxID=591202 RepID=A0A316ECT7_9BACT|nr:methyltransferase [Arcicella aurantiaca]PWK28344.1 tRNA1Val (adenine37-N6)-methyltransferase [Arcicella aurantiaca]
MPANTHFSFKKFTIHQDQTAMKVTTDACILGAYTNVAKTNKILDIGTGTGLVAMMLAQRTEAEIDAVEIDTNAYNQAQNNIQESVFKEQISVFNTSIQDFSEISVYQNKYDLIVSNPPFFQNHLKAEETARNNSIHTDTLSFEDLIQSVLHLIASAGTFVVLLPAYESSVLESLAISKGLYPHKKLTIRHREGTKILRIITTFGQANQAFENQELFIKDANENYTHDFQNLLKEYYLIF